MNRNTKKGFTIVELIIVIAVIGILAAVLIPTFSGLIRKAMLASDEALVKNLNTALAADAENGTHATMSKALTAAKNFGFDVDKINAKAGGNEILWDSYNDCFVYVDEGKVTYIPNSKLNGDPADHQLWKIYDKAADIPATTAQKYSIYLADNTATALNSTLAVGFDAGQNTKLTEVTYVGAGSAKEVVINTNGGELKVTGNNDTIKHYGSANKITVDGTYHEYGATKQLVAIGGTVTTQASSVVVSIVAQPAGSSKVTIDVSKKVTEVVVEEQYNANTTVVGTTAVKESATNVNALKEAQKYPADAASVPAGFIVDKTARTLTIKDDVALMYYGYVLDSKKALALDVSKGVSDYKSFWYSNGEYEYDGKFVTVTLESDIDLNGAIFEKGMNTFGHSFDGQGHTIKNAKVLDYASQNVGLFAHTRYARFSNLTLDNITVVTNADEITERKDVSAGILAGATSVPQNNITIKNSSVTGGKYTGGLIGYVYGSIVGCKLENVSVSGQYKVGGVSGYVCVETKDAVRTIQINNNILTSVNVKAENVMQGKTEVVGKIVGNYNVTGSDVSGECIGNTFTGNTTATNNIGRVEDFKVKEN